MPSFTIEAPAEANPFNEELLYRVLVAATSSDPHQVQTSTKQLQNWESVDGFHSTLQSLYMTLSLPFELRYLAIIQLKNAVEKRWKKGASRTLSQQEKDLIKSRSVDSVLNEPIDRLALQSAIFTAKVLRAEHPRDWATAVEGLTGQLRTIWKVEPSSRQLSRLLLLLLFVAKEAASARLVTFRTSLRSQARNLSEAIFTVYEGLASKWLTFLQFGGDDEGGALDSMETSLLALRTLRRVLTMGFENPNRDSTVCELWPVLISQMDRMLSILSADADSTLPLNDRPKYLVERHLMQISKLHLNMAREHPAAFVLLPQSMDLAKSYWTYANEFGRTYGKKQAQGRSIKADEGIDDEDEISFAEQFSLKGLLLLRACSKMVHNPQHTFKYQDERARKEKAEAKELVHHQLLATDFVREIVKALVSRFFVFTPRDLKQWEQEPEEWEKSQEVMGEDWEFSIRTCAEKLFLESMINYKDDLVEHIMKIILTGASSMASDIWLKDSIYSAIGLAAPVLQGNFDFPDFLQGSLVPDVSANQPDYNIIRRRVAIVLGQWLPVKEGLNRPLVYEIFQHLLNPEDPLNDEVVRITAGRKIGDVIDPFEFQPTEFVPYAPTIISRVLSLVRDASLPESKLALMNTLHIIVVRMEGAITPFGDQILSSLPPLWDASSNELLIQEMILSILVALLESMRADSRKYHPLLIPLIASSTSISDSKEPYLAEEALNLWSTIIDQTPEPASESVVGLLHNLLPMLELATEMLDRALNILDAYIYLIPNEIIKNASLIFGKLLPIIRGKHRESVGNVTHTIDLILCNAFQIGGTATEEVVSALISTDILPSILTTLHEAHEAHQTSGPNRKSPPIEGVVETDFLSILARIAIASPDIFLSAYTAAQRGVPIDWLLDEWFLHIDNISYPDRKKLSCLALTNFLATTTVPQPFILSRLQLLMSMWTSVLMEVEIEVEDESRPGEIVKRDCLIWLDGSFDNEDANSAAGEGQPQSPSLMRSRRLSMADVLHRVETKVWIREKLGVAVQMCGGMDAFSEQWVANVDKEVLDAFGGLAIF